MIKINVKKIVKILAIFIIIMIMCLCCTVQAATNKNEQVSNLIEDVTDEEEVSTTIKDLILTINSEGMSKSLLAETINLYSQLTKTYTNNEIASMIEENKKYLEQENVAMDNVNTVVTFLKSVDSNQLNKVLQQIDVDKIANKISNGASIQSILKDITGSMSAVEKVNFVVDILLSAYVVKTALTVLVALFIYRTLLRCVIYKKAHKKAWAPFIPIYRNVVMLRICGMSPWWLLLLLVPILGWIILFVISVASKFMLAESFGKGTGFAFGLWLLAPIFETILVFSRKTKYIGFEEENEE